MPRLAARLRCGHTGKPVALPVQKVRRQWYVHATRTKGTAAATGCSRAASSRGGPRPAATSHPTVRHRSGRLVRCLRRGQVAATGCPHVAPPRSDTAAGTLAARDCRQQWGRPSLVPLSRTKYVSGIHVIVADRHAGQSQSLGTGARADRSSPTVRSCPWVTSDAGGFRLVTQGRSGAPQGASPRRPNHARR